MVMKRTFQLQIEGKKPERVLDSIKHEVRKYLKRERRRILPLDTDYWDFDCKFGISEETSEVVHLSTVIGHIDEIAKTNATQLYVEIVAKALKRKPRVSNVPIDSNFSDHEDLAQDAPQPEEHSKASPKAHPIEATQIPQN